MLLPAFDIPVARWTTSLGGKLQRKRENQTSSEVVGWDKDTSSGF